MTLNNAYGPAGIYGGREEKRTERMPIPGWDVPNNYYAPDEEEIPTYGIDDVRRELADECALAGGQKSWAVKHSLSTAYVNDVLSRRKEPGKSLLDALGFERVVLYRRA